MTSPPEFTPDRRTVLSTAAAMAAASLLPACSKPASTETLRMSNATEYPISLAQWSLHRELQSGELDPLDFAKVTREDFGLGGVEYVNSFFKDKSQDTTYLDDLKRRAADQGVVSLLIMVDGEGAMGDPDAAALKQTIDNHRRWLEAAAHLGCHSIRVNAQSEGTPDEQRDRCARGFELLLPFAGEIGLDVIIENHGGLSSNGAWLASLIEQVDDARLGTLPDFGNFVLNWDTGERYDRYLGIEELMPYAKALSAKSHDFNEAGEETQTDYARMMKIARDANYHGWVGIEYEGDTRSERAGILATRDLLLRNGCRTT